tara:strand:+ start:316 stop:531 length:216 start_codon:yes stop_codon:yes gene_type:complete
MALCWWATEPGKKEREKMDFHLTPYAALLIAKHHRGEPLNGTEEDTLAAIVETMRRRAVESLRSQPEPPTA